MKEQFRRVYSPFVRVAQVSNSVGTLVIYALVVIMNIDVMARNLFNAPMRGVVEVVVFSLILIVFLQLPDVVRSNRLTRSDGFLLFAEIKFPKFGQTLSRLIEFAAFVFMCLIAWTIWPEVIESIESCHFFSSPEFGTQPTGDFFADLSVAFGRCEYFGTPGIFTAPWWPAKLAIGFSVSLCAIIFLFKAFIGEHSDTTPIDMENLA